MSTCICRYVCAFSVLVCMCTRVYMHTVVCLALFIDIAAQRSCQMGHNQS